MAGNKKKVFAALGGGKAVATYRELSFRRFETCRRKKPGKNNLTNGRMGNFLCRTLSGLRVSACTEWAYALPLHFTRPARKIFTSHKISLDSTIANLVNSR
jgi:hypothetical protein